MKLKQLGKKFNNIHFLSLLTNGSVAALGVISNALLCRALSLNDRGEWLVFLTTFLTVDSLRSGFLTTAFIKFYAGAEKEKADRVAGSSWFIALVITLGICIINIPTWFIAGHIKDTGLSLFFKWVGINMLVSLPYFMAICLLQAQARFDKLLRLRLFNIICFIAFILILYFANLSTTQYTIYAYMLSFAISSMVALLTGWSQVQTFSKKSREHILELYHFGKFSVGTIVSANMFWTIETYIVRYFLGPAALAVLDIGVKLLEIIEIPLRSFAASGMPLLSAAYNNNDPQQVLTTMKKMIGMLTVIMVPVILVTIVFAEIPISLLGGGKYVHTEAVNLFRIFLVLCLLFPADRYMALTLDAIHKPRVNFYKALVMLAVIVIADIIGIQLTGNIYGIAYASPFPIIIAILISYYHIQKYTPFRFWDIYRFGYQETWKNLEVIKKRFTKS
ncbi:Membrane protein involved in the export of O-antigen and teichoic acid [Filimonas lacunae]|uniref:Membrane protein involved in the export of O-antigen and teichoic acid n=1 Tax=Filimonas lacunae TaxID=477680 RepID=A0A173MCT9_9BACT|nr:lipopolysaccharide biosynthesis protein [Filimonas lacunae]BAV05299.1 polysaccharide biosynthesis protein [Filimonas lacunae]SIT22107.1 Membrane protein involved in the export of O-antigen and teichoic acid [Filimonas lacunae]